jgi:ATP-dependent RNA helicase DDX27
MGFMQEIEEIVKTLPKNRTSLLFSATMTEHVDKLIKLSLNRPMRILVEDTYRVATGISQEFVKLTSDVEIEREAALYGFLNLKFLIFSAICSRNVHEKCLIFCQHKKTAHRLRIMFNLFNLTASELHGNLTQARVHL